MCTSDIYVFIASRIILQSDILLIVLFELIIIFIYLVINNTDVSMYLI